MADNGMVIQFAVERGVRNFWL